MLFFNKMYDQTTILEVPMLICRLLLNNNKYTIGTK